MSFGDGNLHERVEQLERENAELRSQVVEALAMLTRQSQTILEQVYRMRGLEKLVQELVGESGEGRSMEVSERSTVTVEEYEKAVKMAEKADMYRRQLGGMNAAHSKRKKELERVKAENAELRRLVLDMWPHVRHRSQMCGECGLHEECRRSESPCLLYGPLEKRMRELGMEVEDED